MAWNVANIQDVLQRINAATNRTPLTMDEVDRRELDAFNELHLGNVERAVQLYTNLIDQLEIQIAVPGNESVGNAERAELQAKLFQLKDQRMALQLASELNPDQIFQRTGLDDEGNPLIDAGTVIDDRQRVLDYYSKRAEYFFKFGLSFNLIAAGVIAFFGIEVTDPCADYVKLMLYTYFIFFPFNLAMAALAWFKVKSIDGDLDQLEHIRRTAYIQTLWPSGTWQHYADLTVDLVNVVGRLIWIGFALAAVAEFDDETCGETAGTLLILLYVMIFIGNLNQWGVIAAIGAVLVIMLLCLPCTLYASFYIWQEIKKDMPVGMQKKELKALQEQKYTKGMVESEEEGEDPICVICQIEFEDGEVVRQLPCEGKHTFHKECVDVWLKKNDTCPLCKTHFSAKGKVREQQEAEEYV